MNPFRTLLVDDEPLALDRLERLLAPHAQVEVIGRAQSGQKALQQIAALRPDLLFLDIQMPELDGFEVLQHLQFRPWVIFCTAYDAYALKAFEACALDYLLKPVAPERLAQSLDKLQRLDTDGSDALAQRLDALAAHLKHPAVRRLQARQGDRIRFVETDHVVFLKAADKYVEAHTKDQTLLLDQSLNQLEKDLPPADFTRIHRSYLINMNHLEEIIRHPNGYQARMADDANSQLPISRQGRTRLGL